MGFFKTKNIIFICIIITAAFFRLWNLSNIPPSASLDEASIGYNAYSVLKTGGDEYGVLPLLSQRAYDDWRRSTYLFLTIPFIQVLGLNALAVRLPAALLSIATVIAVYFIVKILFAKTKFAESIALITTLLLAINPWHVYISRLGHESNACFSFFIFAIMFFLQGIKNKNMLVLSFIFFVLSTISYYSGQALIPLFIVSVLFIFRKELLAIVRKDRKILIPFIIMGVLTIPIVITIFSPASLTRFQGTSTFKPEAHQLEYDNSVKLRNEAARNHNVIGLIVYNRRLFPVKVFLQGYISHFNPKWLFTNSGNEPFKMPNMGLLYIWEAPFIIIGILVLLLSKLFDVKTKQFIFMWFLLAPIPASIATQAPHAMRSYNFLPTWQIFTALAIVYVGYVFKSFTNRIFLLAGVFILYSAYFLYANYFIVFPKQQSNSYQYALHKAINYVKKNEGNYTSIVISNKDNLYQSYMFYLFDTKYDPAFYHTQGGTKSGGYAETHKIGKYEFRPIVNTKAYTNTLFVGNYDEIIKIGPPEKAFANLDGKNVIYTYVQK